MLEISVIIPVYNAAEFLERAVNSALQFDEVKEIVLIEDKSTDRSLEICQKLVSRKSKDQIISASGQRKSRSRSVPEFRLGKSST
jgi:Glycosyltransferases involved in cell wall biogenesis